MVGVGGCWGLGVSGQVLVDELWWTGDGLWMMLCCYQVVSVNIWWWIMDGCWWMDDDGWVLVNECWWKDNGGYLVDQLSFFFSISVFFILIC